MSFILQILGSGTSVPAARRMAPAYLVRSGATDVLMDCGSGATTSLIRARADLETIAGVVLTHFHPDHTSDIVPLLFALTNPAGPKREKDLTFWGPVGMAAHLRSLELVYGHWIKPTSCRVQIVEIAHGDSFSVGSMQFKAYHADHTETSLAYRIEHGDFAMCYSGDSGPCPTLVKAAMAVDLFLCECSEIDGQVPEKHLGSRDVGLLAAEANCQEVILTHLYDPSAGVDLIKKVKENFHGPVLLARDGMMLDLERLGSLENEG